jgi:glycosyltransferase involved in cell wall biosynthesis
MASKLVSVIIPVYQGEKYLAAALASILAQNYRPIEIVVVDDGSTDGTASIAQSFHEVRYIYQENQGHSVAKSTGLRYCTGDLITFLDADDLWAKDSLDIQIECLATHPEMGCVMGKMRNFLEEHMVRPKWVSEEMLTEDIGSCALGASLTHRWVFDQLGHFDPRYWHGNDLDWLIRIRDAGIPVYFIPDVLLHRRIHNANLSQDQNVLAHERIVILKAHLDRRRGKIAPSLSGVLQ